MLDPIKDDGELRQCLAALLRHELQLDGRFMVEPEDALWRHCLALRRLIRDYLNSDKRL